MNQIVQEIFQGLVDGQNVLVQEKVGEALKNGVDPVVILNEGMIAAMTEVGRRFEEGEYYVPEMLIAARAMQAGMSLLKPELQGSEVKSAGKVVIGTVKGDLHDIGKNLVAMMLEGAGFEIQDLGTDVAPEKFIEAAQTADAGSVVLAMSALLTTTMTNMKATISALEAAGLRDKVRVLVGGAPVTESYAQQIGADGYAVDASRAVSKAKQLLAA
jgi:5-methyltetrahydrofolate--homocysteine methyltransferase